MIKVNKNPEYFLTVAAERSISRAAEKLFISQPYLSQHILRLEEDYGTQLFDRKKTPLELTEAGRVYRNYLESSVYLYHKVRADIGSLAQESSRSVHIGVGNWRGSLLLPAVLPDFLASHPDTQVVLHEYPVSELNALVQREEVAFAVMNTDVDAAAEEGLSLEIIGYERILLVLRRDMPQAAALLAAAERGDALDLSLLCSARHIMLSRNLTVGAHLSNFLDRSYLRFSHQISTTNNATALALVAQGVGFCFMVETGLPELQGRDGLTAIDLKSPDLMIPLSIVRKRDSFLTPAEQELLTLIHTHYRNTLGKR